MPSKPTEDEPKRSANVSKTKGKASAPDTEALDPPSVVPPVYDFLYHDVRRVGSFLAQFESFGVRQSVKTAESVATIATQKTAAVGEGGVPLVAKGVLSLDVTTVDEDRDAAEHVYDPFWSNAVRLIDLLHEKDIVRTEIDDDLKCMGQFVLLTGQLMLIDLSFLKPMWGTAAMQEAVRRDAGLPARRVPRNRAEKRAAANHVASDEIDQLIQVLPMLPHSLQARFIAPGVNIWCVLEESAVVGRASDLILKHGALIQGHWNMLGILDGLVHDPNYKSDDGEDLGEIFAQLAETPIGQMAARMGPLIRSMMGKPPTAFGVTPLLIYRDVTKSAGDEQPSA